MPEGKEQVKKTINFTNAGYYSYESGKLVENVKTFPRKLSVSAVIRELKKIAGDGLIQKSIAITQVQKVYVCDIDTFLSVAHEQETPATVAE